MSKVVRVVLLGKTGAGKSSTGNTLLGRDAFRVARGLKSGTERCQWADEEREDVVLQVTDTPGLCDTHRDEKEVLKEVGKSVAVARPGPHVLLMVLRCDARFTEEEHQAYNTLKALFGETIKRHLILVFVGADNFGETLDEQRDGVRAEMEKASGYLSDVLRDADDRYFAINNKASRGDRERQARDLLHMMNKLIRSNAGEHFSNPFSDEVTQLVDPLVQRRMQEDNMTKPQAERETNQAIVDEKESPNFFHKLLDVVSNKVLPLVDKALDVAADAVQLAKEVKKSGIKGLREGLKSVKSSSQCSVM